MCGIVGANGPENSAELVVSGLKKLEYRGYDSWGLAWKKRNDQIGCLKKTGKISQTGQIPVQSTLVIGHTRWATHGKVCTANAHPHFSQDSKVAVVHNGIIENHAHLKKELAKKGFRFKSQTDTETISQMVSHYLQKFPPKKAVQKTAKRFAGSFAIAALVQNENSIFAFKKNAPLVIGKSPNGFSVASDAAALFPSTTLIHYLPDNQLAIIGKKTEVLDLKTGKNISIRWEKITRAAEASKNGYAHFMLKEIHEQPKAIERIAKAQNRIPLRFWNKINSIVLLGCGTSWHAGVYGEYLFEKLLGIPVHCEYASEFRYRHFPLSKKTLIIALSQSGETADTLAAVQEAKKKGCRILALCNNENSSIARTSDSVIPLLAGPEIGVASTKTFTAQAAAMVRLAAAFPKAKNKKTRIRLEKELKKIPQKISQILKKRGQFRRLAKKICAFSNAVFLGRDNNYPVALEGALKLKEVSYIHAEGMPAAEMKHGPIALIDKNMPVIAIATQNEILSKVLSNLQEIKARRGKLIIITDSPSHEIKKLANELVVIPKTMDELSPLLTVIPLQLLAYEAALFKHCDVDKPRNLAKSVTVE